MSAAGWTPPPTTTAAAMLSGAPPEPEDFVVGALPVGELALIVGSDGSGKSDLALQIALSVVTGRPIAGGAIEPPEKSGPVLYYRGGRRWPAHPPEIDQPGWRDTDRPLRPPDLKSEWCAPVAAWGRASSCPANRMCKIGGMDDRCSSGDTANHHRPSGDVPRHIGVRQWALRCPGPAAHQDCSQCRRRDISRPSHRTGGTHRRSQRPSGGPWRHRARGCCPVRVHT